MCRSLFLYIEAKRTKKDVKRFEEALTLLTDEDEIEKIKYMIKLRKALWSKDFYSYVNKSEIP